MTLEEARLVKETLVEWLYGNSFIVCTTEDATQNSLGGQQPYNDKVVAPEQVKLTEMGNSI